MTEGREIVTGEVGEVLDAADPRKLTKLSIFVSNRSHPSVFDSPLQISFDGSRNRGVKLQVESTKPDWTRSTSAALVQEIKLGARSWGKARSFSGGLSVLILVFAATFFLVSSILSKIAPELLLSDNVWATILSAIAALVAGASLSWFCPPFELTENGSSGTRRTIGLIAFIAQVPLGLLVNFLSG